MTLRAGQRQRGRRSEWRRCRAGILSGLSVPLMLALSACDPQASLHGRLTGADGQPLTVGEIRIECPQLCLYVSDVNDRGDFYESKISRGCPLNCQLHAASVGHRDFVASASDYCVKRNGSLCSEFQANVKLEASP
jgi:hypothetical protein